MARSQETLKKKDVKNKKDKKRKEKELKKIERRESDKKNSFEDMIAYVDEFGVISSTPPDPDKKKNVVLTENIEISTPKQDSTLDLDPVRKGTVTFFNEAKGYGFIKDSESQESIFVHVNNLLEEIKEGNLVNYEVERGPKGYTATQVKVCR
jgi:cold shock CspA family protein